MTSVCRRRQHNQLPRAACSASFLAKLASMRAVSARAMTRASRPDHARLAIFARKTNLLQRLGVGDVYSSVFNQYCMLESVPQSRVRCSRRRGCRSRGE
eukprot:3001346-Pyramimonas_sp.AAC.1